MKPEFQLPSREELALDLLKLRYRRESTEKDIGVNPYYMSKIFEVADRYLEFANKGKAT